MILLLSACAGEEPGNVLRISGSAVGAEGEILTRQVGRFMAANPGVRVDIQRTPDDATQRHQLYVQWLNAQVGRPRRGAAQSRGVQPAQEARADRRARQDRQASEPADS